MDHQKTCARNQDAPLADCTCDYDERMARRNRRAAMRQLREQQYANVVIDRIHG